MEILDSDQVGFIGVSQLPFASNGEKLCAALGEEFANPSTKLVIRVNQLEMHCAFPGNGRVSSTAFSSTGSIR